MSGEHSIDLLVPGLFGPVPVHPDDLPSTSALARALGRADKLATAGTDPVSALLDCFGIEGQPDRDPPSAPYCWLADGPHAGPGRGYVMHADPVHLRPDRDRLLLFDARHLALTQEESNALADMFNEHFSAEGMHLEAPEAGRWYLLLESAPDIRTTSLNDAVGRSIGGLLPRGRDLSAWAQMMNEAQMLFHHADTNRIREREGRPTVSGIWPWGGGRLPVCRTPSDYATVRAADHLALGLAAASESATGPLPESASVLTASREPGGNDLVFWDRLWPAVLDTDGTAWIEGVRRLERWLEPLVAEPTRLGDRLLRIHPCNGECFAIGAWGLRRFWRRPCDLAAWVSIGAGPDAPRTV